MRSNSIKTNVEPFNLFGVSSTIWDIENAQNVVKANVYYFYVIVGVTVFQYLNQVMANLHTEIERNVLLATALLILVFTFLVRFTMNRVAAILLLANFIWNFIDAILESIRASAFQSDYHTLGVIIMGLMVAASYRTVRGTFAYARFMKNQDTANKRMQSDAAKPRR